MTIELTNRENEVAGMFKALGDPTRLQIVRYLMCCPEMRVTESDGALVGATVGDVCCQIEGPPSDGKRRVSSRISHHVKELKTAGVIDVERRGRFMVCRINSEAAQMISEFAGLLGSCCTENTK